MKPLTPNQAECLDYITTHITDKGYPPTIREIGEWLGMSSTNGVRTVLTARIKKGRIERVPGTGRGIRLIKQNHQPEYEI